MSALAIADARSWVRDYARNASDQTQYPAARIDRAIQYIGTEFVKFARCTRQTSTVALVNNSASVSVAAITSFRPEYLVGDPKAWITVSGAFTASVEVVALDVLLELQLHRPSTSAPCSRRSKLSFTGNDNNSTATIYPTIPNDSVAYVLNLMWAPPFPTWTPGGTPSPDSFGIPDEYMKALLTLYVPRALQHNEPEHKYAADRDAEFMDYCRLCSGSGNLGVASIQCESIHDFRRGR